MGTLSCKTAFNQQSQSPCRPNLNERWEPDEHEVRALAMTDFDVTGVLGVGTYGVVKLAKHIRSGASVALKVLSKEHIVSMRQEKHILRERMVHLQLKHPFIARLYGTFQDDDCLYLVIEYLPGGELWSLVYSEFDNNDENDEDEVGDDEGQTQVPIGEQDGGENARHPEPMAVVEKDTEARESVPTEAEDEVGRPLTKKLKIKLVVDEPPLLREQTGRPWSSSRPNSPTHAMRLDAKSRGLLRNNHGGLKEDHAVFYLACILRALEYLHRQDMLYRDLKLENLVLDRTGYPKVLDFGFAKLNAAKSTRNMTLCGSMDYMAPEILLHEPHDQRVDIWSFGIIMYELLLGKTPFYHENAREVGRKITSEPVAFPNEFEDEHPLAFDLINKLLVKSPEGRLKCMEDVKAHAFFARAFPCTQSWERLERKERPAPFIPKLAGPFDTSFFQTMDDCTEDELDDCVQPYFEDGSHIFSAF